MSENRIEIKKSPKIILVFGDGKEYTCTKGTLGASIEMERRLAEEKAKGAAASGSAIIRDHLVNCGLPKAVALGLDTDECEAVMQALSPAKKNSAP